jgi:periplasmic protein TonB
MIRANEILFKNRNKLYGAYDLRKKYPLYTFIGFIGSLVILVFILAFVYYLIFHDEFASLPMDDYLPDKNELIDLQQINLPDIEMLRKPEVILPKDALINPVLDENAEERDIVEVKDEDLSASKDTTNKEKDLAAADSAEKKETEDEISEILSKADEMPEYMQGADELRKFIFKNTVYPDSALKQKIQGIVLVQFVVTKHGEVKNLKLLKGVSPLLDREALRVTKLISSWKPGRQKGKPVNVQYVIPFNFRI